MRQSNIYILLYSAAITVVCGGLLAFASISLKDAQDANIAMEQKKNILSAVMTLKEEDDIVGLYNSKVKSFVIDYQGNVVEGKAPEQVVVAVEYKKAPKERLLPVYEFRNETDPNKVDYAVLPVFGYGLWNNIWGFVAVRSDFNTIQGVKFQHAGETPGLGARIESDEVQERFKEKTIFENGALVSVKFQKGEGKDYSNDKHKVDGLSSATLTGKGVNNMLVDYLACYEKYLKKNSNNQ
ncbi:MAG TPA: NADH:ubiquinone reductase (Na(+)-transporting) subunit C [Cyclobacteriaceae bacterium]|nr:NADH:ubiquinone reductase (Na(+)-transporting) subunit C [Cyclobacteriaceae bacterium]